VAAGAQPTDDAGLHREFIVVLDRLDLDRQHRTPLDRGEKRRPMLREETDLVDLLLLRGKVGERRVDDLQRGLEGLALRQVELGIFSASRSAPLRG
jgi:hypothetical protein